MRFSSGDASDDGSGPDSTWNLGGLVHDGEQVVELIGGDIGTHFDRVADACRRLGAGVELACRGHANAVQFDAGFPVNVIEYAAGCREVEKMPASEIGFHGDPFGVHRCRKLTAEPEEDLIVPVPTATSKRSPIRDSFRFLCAPA